MNTMHRTWSTFDATDPTGTLRWRDAAGAVARALGTLAAALGIARTRRAPPLVLDLPERTVTFNGTAEFEFCLDSRTQYPVRRISELIGLPAEELRKRARDIRRVEKRFADALGRSIREPEAIGELLYGLGGKIFSQDHDWREIAECVVHQPPRFDAYKRLVLVKYLQYLGSRQEVLRSLYSQRVIGGDARAPAEPAAAAASDEPASAPRAAEDETRVAALHDTAIFDLGTRCAENDRTHVDLPRGEPIAVAMRDGRELPLLLAGERFTLFPGPRFHLVDAAGGVHELKPGRNVVGRHSANEVVIASTQRSISRRHLVIEPTGIDTVLLTDLSSLGTALPRDFAGSSAG